MGTDSSNNLRGILIMGEPVNWVQRRQECTVKEIFNGPLREQVEFDVDHAGEGFEFGDTNRVGTIDAFFVGVKGKSRSRAFFLLLEDHIDIEPYTGKAFSVVTHWNPDRDECSLRVSKPESDEKEDIAIWQISQRALSKLFFG
ncbi:MAG: hypothetical protein F4206_16475 [Gammaproteobacteria bacterium]|nr:hypothetical protein [Gammaproteobacteria bacterium]MYG68303.1 hypothetical protein [Gammaproteobacteria bacterium]